MQWLVELRRAQTTRTPAGEELTTWPTVYATVWAAKKDARGMLRYTARQFQAEQLTEFQIYYRTDILISDRLFTRIDRRTYEILQIAEIGRQDGLDILAQSITR